MNNLFKNYLALIAKALELLALSGTVAVIVVTVPRAYVNLVAAAVILLWSGWLVFRIIRDTVRGLTSGLPLNDKQALILEILRAHRAGLFAKEIVQLSDGALTTVTIHSDLALLRDQELVLCETITQTLGATPPPISTHEKG